jgi:hypothetical protein
VVPIRKIDASDLNFGARDAAAAREAAFHRVL